MFRIFPCCWCTPDWGIPTELKYENHTYTFQTFLARRLSWWDRQFQFQKVALTSMNSLASGLDCAHAPWWSPYLGYTFGGPNTWLAAHVEELYWEEYERTFDTHCSILIGQSSNNKLNVNVPTSNDNEAPPGGVPNHAINQIFIVTTHSRSERKIGLFTQYRTNLIENGLFHEFTQKIYSFHASRMEVISRIHAEKRPITQSRRPMRGSIIVNNEGDFILFLMPV